MSTLSQDYRKRAAENRAEAELTLLPNARNRLLMSAYRLDELASQAERVDDMKAARA